MDKTKRYITKQQLRELGMEQPDREILPILRKANQQVAQHIETEMFTEISVNYDQALLNIYLELIEKHGFSSEITQDWLKQHLAGPLSSITRDWIEITLGDIRRNTQT
jgi:hypothetical protein